MLLAVLTGTDNSIAEFAVPNAASGLWQYNVYLFVHILALLIGVVILFLTMRSKSSKAQTAVVIFEIGAIFYILGFVEEILADTAEGGFIACITQYAGEFIVFTAALFFVSQLCSVRIPIGVYVAQMVFSMLALFALMSTRTYGWFYRTVSINRDGLFSRPELAHTVVFFMVFAYFFIISAYVLKICIEDFIAASPLQRKRLVFLMIATVFCWIPWVLTLAGLTGGYEIPALGITCAGVCLYLCFVRYGFFDSQVLAGSNATEHSKEGILVVDSKYRVRYQNKRIFEIFGKVYDNSDMMEHAIFSGIFKGETKTYVSNGKTYEFDIEPLMESTYVLGYMLWVNDATEHYDALERIEIAATHDTLTGLYNRTKFQSLVEADLESGKSGTFVIFDMDNFKGVNDTYGHQCGDAVLNTFAGVLKQYGEQRLYSCRLGGDEFCVFLRNVTERGDIEMILKKIFGFFDDGLKAAGFENYTSLSAGVKASRGAEDFNTLYKEADAELYKAKTGGKRQFKIAE